MASRRSRGDGGLYWSEDRQRWIAELTIGYRPNGKRITRKASGKTKTEAKAALDRLVERRKARRRRSAGSRSRKLFETGCGTASTVAAPRLSRS
jgi:hypothetical protein